MAGLGRKQEEAIAALLTQRSVEEAARGSGVGTRTLLRWIKTPEFVKADREARRATFTQSVARLQQATSAAATTLLKTLIDPGAPASVRVRAAESILSHAAEAIEMEDLDLRRRRTGTCSSFHTGTNKVKSLPRRIAKLEQSRHFPEPEHLRKPIMDRALATLTTPGLFLLMDAAKEPGRPLTAEEIAAKERLATAFDMECQWAGYKSAADFNRKYRSQGRTQ